MVDAAPVKRSKVRAVAQSPGALAGIGATVATLAPLLPPPWGLVAMAVGGLVSGVIAPAVAARRASLKRRASDGRR